MVGKMKGLSEITAIPNKYKNTFHNLTHSSDRKSENWPNSLNLLELIAKRLCNMPKLRYNLLTLLKVNY